jgi:uncharacterized protein (DUF433 family)
MSQFTSQGWHHTVQCWTVGRATNSDISGDEALSVTVDLALAGPKSDAVTMLDWSQCPAVERVAGLVSGDWVFKETRVPVRALFENLEGGATVRDFLSWFPGVTQSQVDAVLEHAQRSLTPA